MLKYTIIQFSLGWTSLHSASYNGNIDVAQLLLKNGAEIDTKDNNGKLSISFNTYNLELMLDLKFQQLKKGHSFYMIIEDFKNHLSL